MRAISCDSSSIITLSSNCLLWLFGKFDTEFLIPLFVRKEIVDNPINSRRYSFEAMRNGLEIGKSLKVEKTDPVLRDKIIDLSNTLLMHKGKPIEIVHYGEADALALALEKGITTILVDEKNTRLLIEDHERLRKVIEKRTGKSIDINGDIENELNKMLGGLKVIRSSEVLAIAVKRGFLDWPYPKRDILKSVLNAAKNSGCSISSEEILEIINNIVPTEVRHVGES